MDDMTEFVKLLAALVALLTALVKFLPRSGCVDES
jgi:hypothetical protein